MQTIPLLYSTQCVKFAPTRLKSNQVSNIYIDLRTLFLHPQALMQVVSAIDSAIDPSLEIDYISGVPMGALPYAVLLAQKRNKPFHLIRNASKDHGSSYTFPPSKILLLEDVCTTGGSILQVKKALELEGHVVHCFCIVMRSNTFLPIPRLLHFDSIVRPIPSIRKHILLHPLAKAIFDLMIEKQSNLCVAADVPCFQDLISLIHQIGEHIVVLKLHSDTIELWDPIQSPRILNQLSKTYRFFILEDRKLADIGSIVYALTKVMKCYAHCVTSHMIAGAESVKQSELPLVLIHSMSSAKNDTNYTQPNEALSFLESYPLQVAGLVSQSIVPPSTLCFTPGVSIETGEDSKGQHYRSVRDVMNFADIVIMGRAIILANDPKEVALKVQREAWALWSEQSNFCSLESKL